MQFRKDSIIAVTACLCPVLFAVVYVVIAMVSCNSKKPIVSSRSSGSSPTDSGATSRRQESSVDASHGASKRSEVHTVFSFDAGFVRQFLFDRSEEGHLLTEELELHDCKSVIKSWIQWNSCLEKKYGDKGSKWAKDKQFIIKIRRLRDLREIARFTPQSLVSGRIVDYRFNRFLILDKSKDSVLIHDTTARNSPASAVKIPNHVISTAKMLLSDSIIVMSYSGRGNRELRAHIHWIKMGDNIAIRQVASFKYPLESFDTVNMDKFGMWHDYVYPLCTGGSSRACDELRHSGGLEYKNSLRNDKSLNLVVSPSGTKLAAYVFGSLYVYEVEGDNILLLRKWNNIFYHSRDHYMTEPSIVWDNTGSHIALASSKRLIKVVEEKSGLVHTVIDRTNACQYEYYYWEGKRGIAFAPDVENSLVYGNLNGNLSIVNYKTGKSRNVKLMRPNEERVKYTCSDIPHSIEAGKSEYLINHGGAVTIVDHEMKVLKGRIGSDLFMSFSRFFSNLEIP